MEWLNGKIVMEAYNIPVFRLAKAIRDGLPAYEAGTGRVIIDQDSLVPRPKYQSIDEAMEARDLLARKYHEESLFEEKEQEIKENQARVLLDNCFVYEFPPGWDKGPATTFPFNYESFERVYQEMVFWGMYGDRDVKDIYFESISMMCFCRQDIEGIFGTPRTILNTPEDDQQIGGSPKNKKRRGKIKQKDAAILCGVSERTIQEWDAGNRTPQDYPGRSDPIVFRFFANRYQERLCLEVAATRANRAVPTEPHKLERMDHGAGDEQDD